MSFFLRYAGSFFNAERVRYWGSTKKGFEALARHSVDDIRYAIFDLVTEKKVTTMTSRKGTTLYGIRSQDAARLRA
jgi:hypothetical protein